MNEVNKNPMATNSLGNEIKPTNGEFQWKRDYISNIIGVPVKDSFCILCHVSGSKEGEKGIIYSEFVRVCEDKPKDPASTTQAAKIIQYASTVQRWFTYNPEKTWFDFQVFIYLQLPSHPNKTLIPVSEGELIELGYVQQS
ncbi:hypothetical protein RFI_07521 [Reticulomyxa filosa]|uniref:Uncharacterized protein n=1 Tax=Reticulomyxa filosa TaxID=46433 RepID=X6NUK2_RETFI|nr:hypothetical protein RFI_07521 [Reticulomyxa filosa]|eukprot:ETO29598.1 hypothetical protein RFI_07521 [Reticulomyxa filosa]